MTRVLAAIDWMNDRFARYFVHHLIVVAMFVLMYEVLGRYLFNEPTIWAHELSQMLYGAYFMLGGGYALLSDSHVNVDILVRRLSKRNRAILDIATSIVFFLFMYALVRYGSMRLVEAVRFGVRSDSAWAPLLWPSLLTLVSGSVLLLLQGVAKFIRTVRTALGEREDER